LLLALSTKEAEGNGPPLARRQPEILDKRNQRNLHKLTLQCGSWDDWEDDFSVRKLHMSCYLAATSQSNAGLVSPPASL